MTKFTARIAALFLIILSPPRNLHAQVDSGRVHESPYTVIDNHLFNLQKSTYHPETAARSFHTDEQTGITLAIQLKQILDAKGLYIDLNRVPSGRHYQDSITREPIYFLDRSNPLLYVERIDSAWYYSRTTVEAIPVLHHKIFPFGTRIAVYFQAPGWQVGILGIPLWKWVGLLVSLLLSTLVFRTINWMGNRTIAPFLQQHMDLVPVVNAAIRKLSRLLGLWLALHFFGYILPMFQLPVWTNAFGVKLLGVLNGLLLILLINQVIHILFFKLHKLTALTNNALDNQLLPVLRRLAFFVVWVLGIIYILQFLDVNITALLAGISIGGLAIALAAQDTVKNFFGSIMIFLDKPFQIGDSIHFNEVEGVVEEVGLRSTRIRTFTNSLTYVPNGLLADKIVDNLGLRIYRRFKTEIGITYDTPPARIDLFVQGIRAILREHPQTRKDYIEVHLHNFGASSLNILLYTFFEVSNFNTELASRHELIYAILTLAEDIGVRLAFPTQTLHIESLPGQPETGSPPVREGTANLTASLKKIRSYFTDTQHRKELERIE